MPTQVAAVATATATSPCHMQQHARVAATTTATAAGLWHAQLISTLFEMKTFRGNFVLGLPPLTQHDSLKFDRRNKPKLFATKQKYLVALRELAIKLITLSPSVFSQHFKGFFRARWVNIAYFCLKSFKNCET